MSPNLAALCAAITGSTTAAAGRLFPLLTCLATSTPKRSALFFNNSVSTAVAAVTGKLKRSARLAKAAFSS